MTQITIPQPMQEGEPDVDLIIRYERTDFLCEHRRGFDVHMPHPKTGVVSTIYIPFDATQIDRMCKYSRGAPRMAAQLVKTILLARGIHRQTELMNIPRNGFFTFPNDPTVYSRLDYCKGEYEVVSMDDFKIVQYRGGVVLVDVVFREEMLEKAPEPREWIPF